MRDENSSRRKNKATGRFNNMDSAAISNFRTALLTVLMMTAESMSSKHPVSKIAVDLFFLLKLLTLIRVC